MTDVLIKAERSALMAKIKSRGNRSTELRVCSRLARAGISGWKRNYKEIPGNPDIFFPRLSFAIFIDGCFWHGCPRCGRIPKSRRAFWKNKIVTNAARDARTRRKLRRMGYHVMSIWEHDLQNGPWFNRFMRMYEELIGALCEEDYCGVSETADC